MINLPEDTQRLQRLTREMIALKSMYFFEWLQCERARLTAENRETRDEIDFRWSQGAAQVLSELAELIADSRELAERI